MNRDVSRRLLVGAAALAVTFALVSSTTQAHAATLTTDKADYAPGETATIFGSFFDALQNVVLSIVGQNADGSTATTATWDVTADDSGAFTTSYTLPDTFVPLYLLAAHSADGTVLTQASFADAVPPACGLVDPIAGSVTSPSSGTVDATWGAASAAVSGSISYNVQYTDGVTMVAHNGISGTSDSASGLTDGTWTVTVNAHFSPSANCSGAKDSGAVTIGSVTLTAVQDQTITVTTEAPLSATYGDDFDVDATASSGLDVEITTDGACSGSGAGSATITMTSGTGICTVHYNQAGNESFNPAPEVTSNTSAEKADASCDIIGYDVTYDGAAHTATGACTGIAGDGTLAGLDLSGTTHTLVGDYSGDQWTFTDDTGNYNDTNGAVDDKIESYIFGGFKSPLSISSKDWKKNSTIPVKFSLMDTLGNPIPYATAVSVIIGGNNATATGGTAFRYDASAGQYIYNLSTKSVRLGANTLTITLNDGSVLNATITIK